MCVYVCACVCELGFGALMYAIHSYTVLVVNPVPLHKAAL